MIILLLLAAVLAASIYTHNEYYSSWGEFVGTLGAIASGLTLGCMLLILPINRAASYSAMAEIEALRWSVNNARERGDSLENVALQHQIIEANQWIASVQYWNDSAFDIFWPDDVDDIKPIK